MSASLKDDLVAAKALIDTPEKWHQGSYRSRLGNAFCAIGALTAATCDADRVSAGRDALQGAMPPGMKGLPAGIYNDAKSTTHADIMALFDRAILAAGDGA